MVNEIGITRNSDLVVENSAKVSAAGTGEKSNKPPVNQSRFLIITIKPARIRNESKRYSIPMRGMWPRIV